MTRNKIIALVVAAVVLIGGGLTFALVQNDTDNDAKMAKQSETMTKDESADSMQKDGDAMAKEDAMAKHGNYVTLAAYNANPDKYADSKKVYFFHASWCPTCQGIDKEITNSPSKVPAGVTIIKTDFDTETALRQKYGVTYQYTFVQVDGQGNEVTQWSASNLDKVIDGIQA